MKVQYLFGSLFLALLLYCSLSENGPNTNQMSEKRRANNVMGTELMSCCTDPMTGFYRDGLCHSGPDDLGSHLVCARVTDAFLQYSKSCGNDLITPYPLYHFPGLKAGDYWCLCISRWLEAVKAGVAPPIKLEATHEKALEHTTLEVLKSYAVERQN